jgi:hypothetical protein
MTIRPAHALLLALVASTASAATPPSQYVGQESREIKSLAPSEVSDLLAGRGMGLARAAELNGYPGPMHVLELSSQLGLSEAQESSTRALFARMQASAKELGAELVAAERALDGLFRDQQATQEALDSALTRIGLLQAKVRGVHLQAHIEQARLLSQHQTAQYMRLRGYGSEPSHQHQHQHRKH